MSGGGVTPKEQVCRKSQYQTDRQTFTVPLTPSCYDWAALRAQVTYYDDIGDAYEWAVKLPVQAISLDFLGVPGSALGNETAALIEKHGFPSDKRLGAGVVDGRSVFEDGEYPGKLIAALQAKVSILHGCQPCYTTMQDEFAF